MHYLFLLALPMVVYAVLSVCMCCPARAVDLLILIDQVERL